jgi:histidine phosphotransfer protein HptB
LSDIPLNRTAAEEPPVNLQMLEPLYAGDTAFQRELVETFITHGQTTLDVIQKALKERDPNALRQAAHSLKGAAGGISAEPLCAAAAVLETAAREGRADPGVEVLVEGVRIHFSRTADFLRATLPRGL